LVIDRIVVKVGFGEFEQRMKAIDSVEESVSIVLNGKAVLGGRDVHAL
jgi:hypothetical protein